MNQANQVIVLMASVHEHMLMEEQLERKHIYYRTVVKPRQLGAECGMALRVYIPDVSKIRQICEASETTIFNVYSRQNGVWKVWNESS